MDQLLANECEARLAADAAEHHAAGLREDCAPGHCPVAVCPPPAAKGASDSDEDEEMQLVGCDEGF